MQMRKLRSLAGEMFLSAVSTRVLNTTRRVMLGCEHDVYFPCLSVRTLQVAHLELKAGPSISESNQPNRIKPVYADVHRYLRQRNVLFFVLFLGKEAFLMTHVVDHISVITTKTPLFFTTEMHRAFALQQHQGTRRRKHKK